MSICIRRARIEDRAAIERFIRIAYQELAPFKGPDRWCWQFVENPFRSDGNDLVPVWIALNGDEIVGQIAVQATDAQVAGKIYSAGWIVDVMILPAYRGRGLGHLLHQAVVNDSPLLLTLTMAPATRHMAERGGAITLGPTRQFSRWTRLRADDVQRYLVQRTAHRRRLRKAVRWACEDFAFHRLFALLANRWLSFRDRGVRRTLPIVSMVEVKSFGPEIDNLWQRTAASYPAICPRNSRFLNWRFVNCPQLQYHVFLARRDGAVVGYSVLRRAISEELRHGIIVDLFADRLDLAVFSDMIVHAVEYFGHEVSSVECATSLPELESLLRKNGFFNSRTLAPTVVTSDELLRNKIINLRNDWFFSKADHDWDQIHLG
ncbi:GNAT superfamily N-acetyltransferase [Bradyrhizobium sp. AZCC 1578]|uniref:GNAT family N-acetyltransferase n=1 Tax=Bradyrhizobium sp. AZCC 1578 TaxID=3117027 RepID=UPI002FF2A0EE